MGQAGGAAVLGRRGPASVNQENFWWVLREPGPNPHPPLPLHVELSESRALFLPQELSWG